MKIILFFSTVALLSVCPSGHADDFTTLDGDRYTNATVKRVDPDGIIVSYNNGVRKLKFKNLSPEIGQKYGYDSAKAIQFQEEVKKTELENQQKAAADQQSKAIKQEQINSSISLLSEKNAEQAKKNQPKSPVYPEDPEDEKNLIEFGLRIETHGRVEGYKILQRVENGLKVKDPSNGEIKVIPYYRLPNRYREAFGFPPPSSSDSSRL